MDPAHWLPHMELCLLAARGGNLEEAGEEAEKAAQLSGQASVAIALVACCRYGLNDNESGETLRARLEERLRERYVPPSFFGWLAAARGEIDEATRWLGRAAETRDPWLAFWRTVPPALIGADPRIEALLSRFDL
jgi:hypothetical protein